MRLQGIQFIQEVHGTAKERETSDPETRQLSRRTHGWLAGVDAVPVCVCALCVCRTAEKAGVHNHNNVFNV